MRNHNQGVLTLDSLHLDNAAPIGVDGLFEVVA